MEKDSPGKTDNSGLDKKGERRVGKREIAIRYLAERDARTAVENVAHIPEHGQMGVLPEDDCGRGAEQQGSSDPLVGSRPETPLSWLTAGIDLLRLHSTQVKPCPALQ